MINELSIFALVVGVVVFTVFMIRQRSRKREPMRGYTRPDPSNLIPSRAEREEAERRYQWLIDNPGEIPPWEKAPAPKTLPKKEPAKDEKK